MRPILSTTTLLASLLLTPALHAGVIKITDAEPGSTASVSFFSGDSSFNSRSLIVDADGNVTFTFSKTEQDGAYKIEKRYIPRGQAPAHVTKNAIFTVGALPPLEPFTLANFVPITNTSDLEVDIDLVPYLAAGTTFTVGQTLTVTAGSIPESPYVTFPGFTGTVVVAPFDQFTPIPEPATLATFSLVTASLLGRRTRSPLPR